jgi:hypothetical protein
MAGDSSKENGHDKAESLIDDLIRDILNEAGASSRSAPGGMGPMAALLETAIASPRAASQTSILERLLLAETFASALAGALAPALAEALAPRVMKVLEQSTTEQSAEKTSPSTTTSGDRGRKAESK